MARPVWNTVVISDLVATVLAENPDRNSILLQNNGAVWLRIGFDATVSSIKGHDLAPKTASSQGGHWSCDDLTAEIHIIAVGAPGSLNYIETINE